jgi:hypothetical protein
MNFLTPAAMEPFGLRALLHLVLVCVQVLRDTSLMVEQQRLGGGALGNGYPS